ncbi:MAG: sugar phosphate isomerase/epimerase [Dehalococcoidia bacterium]|nr:sugar phosphate isomerase/epimerase [Dehalococcoidia bacterium]
MTLSLSTMWAQQERFLDDMHVFVRESRALGYDAIEAAHSLPEAPFERLLTAPDARISSIHAPAPLVRYDGRANSALNIAALDDGERGTAIDYAKRSIDHTRAAGGRYVVVHLGGVGNAMFEAERELRRLYDSGTRDGQRVEELRATCLRQRAEQAAPWLERAREALAELVRHAAAGDVAIGIENRLHYHEIPQPDEAVSLLAGVPPERAGYWHDVGHAEVQWRLGLVDKRVWLERNGARCIGAHLHDVTGLADHRAPGNGDVDWGYIAAGLPEEALRVFEINQSQTAEDVAAAIPFLRERGVIA